jgi:hypothetical protein
MTFRELAAWVLETKQPGEQVVMSLQEDEDPEETLEEVGGVCHLPFVAHTNDKHKRVIKGKPWPEETSHRLYINLWENEELCKPETPYTWQQLVDWIYGLPDSNIEATALCAWHLCQLKILQNGMLYAYEVD